MKKLNDVALRLLAKAAYVNAKKEAVLHKKDSKYEMHHKGNEPKC